MKNLKSLFNLVMLSTSLFLFSCGDDTPEGPVTIADTCSELVPSRYQGVPHTDLTTITKYQVASDEVTVISSMDVDTSFYQNEDPALSYIEFLDNSEVRYKASPYIYDKVINYEIDDNCLILNDPETSVGPPFRYVINESCTELVSYTEVYQVVRANPNPGNNVLGMTNPVCEPTSSAFKTEQLLAMKKQISPDEETVGYSYTIKNVYRLL